MTARVAFRVAVLIVSAALGLTAFAVPAQAASKKPTISKISPSAGPLTGTKKVAITGKNFTKTSKVYFGSKNEATIVTYSSSKKLYADAPAAAAGAVSVQVATSKGASNSKTFTYMSRPSIESISPHSGGIAGGTTITITGVSFVAPTTITFDKTNVSATVRSSTELSVKTPEHAAGDVSVTVSNKYGVSSAKPWTYAASAPTNELKVGSFNVRVASGYHTSRQTNEKPWTTRLPAVADQLTDANLDVFGIQEASASTKYTKGGVAQFRDVVDAVGSPYALTNANRYCYDRDQDGDGRCVTGASSSDRIVYNSDRLELLRNGSRKLDTRNWDDGSGRYVVWAAFKVRDTGKNFFFVSTHLEPGSSNDNLRATQAAIILDEIDTQNTAHLPVILVGDLSATKFASSSAAHTSLTRAGFIDPLVNTAKYKGLANVDTAVNINFSGNNYFGTNPIANKVGSAYRPQIVAGNYPVGSYLDYIMTRGDGFNYKTWETVLELRANGDFTDVIPSDHNLITMSMTFS